MRIHVVAGFLGAGKTSAIIRAATSLQERGERVGVVTNDQGRHLVDTAFAKAARIPAVEVTGGCFCCRYDDFESTLSRLTKDEAPTVIFAESVGSCADVVVTVVSPLRQAIDSVFVQKGASADFTVFADACMLLRRLEGKRLPFSEEVLYVYDRQIEEAGVLVLNKIDLLGPEERTRLGTAVARLHPRTIALPLSCRDEDGAQAWLKALDSAGPAAGGWPLQQIDYDRYSSGELRLAWFDGTLQCTIPEGQGDAVRRLFSDLVTTLRATGAGVGHLKIIVSSGDGTSWKASATALGEDTPEALPRGSGAYDIAINARVELDAEELGELLGRSVEATFQGTCSSYTWITREAFHPGEPRPQRGRILS